MTGHGEPEQKIAGEVAMIERATFHELVLGIAVVGLAAACGGAPRPAVVSDAPATVTGLLARLKSLPTTLR